MGHHSCLLFNFLDHIALWIVVVAFAFALFMPAFIISTTAGKQELEKGQARDVGETHGFSCAEEVVKRLGTLLESNCRRTSVFRSVGTAHQRLEPKD